jgi:predicted deacylase
MKAIKITDMWLLGAALSVALIASVGADATDSAKVMPYEGQIQSIKIDKCGLQAGSCEGSIILAQAGGAGEVRLAVKPGTWLKRGDQLATIDELGVGNYVKVRALQIPRQPLQEITPVSAGRSS